MPTVGGRKFKYSPAGRKAARKYAKTTGKKISMHKQMAMVKKAKKRGMMEY